MKKLIIDDFLKIILILSFIGLISFFIKEYITSEIEQYEYYSDYTRADIVMRLSFNKDHTLQYEIIRYVQSFNDNEKLSKGDLIYDFASYEFIPILNYLNKTTENKKLIDSFSGILDFLADYNSATIYIAENILVRQENGKYYRYKDGVYTYDTKKEVISKKSFNKIYNEYLKEINYQTVLDKFLNNLYSNSKINSKYSYNELKNKVLNDYDKFYQENEDIVIQVISDDIKAFSEYLYKNYIFIDKDNGDKRHLIKNIDTETLEMSFNFTEGDRIYKGVSKYYNHIYLLDINNVWQQLQEKGYPMLYS